MQGGCDSLPRIFQSKLGMKQNLARYFLGVMATPFSKRHCLSCGMAKNGSPNSEQVYTSPSKVDMGTPNT